MVPRASLTYSSSPHESAFVKRVRDSELGQPRSDTVSPNRLNLDDKEGISYMPTSIYVTETKVKECEICPILTQHFVYPFTNHSKPTLITDNISLPDEAHAKRHVKIFDGEEVILDGPILMDIVCRGLTFRDVTVLTAGL